MNIINVKIKRKNNILSTNKKKLGNESSSVIKNYIYKNCGCKENKINKKGE